MLVTMHVSTPPPQKVPAHHTAACAGIPTDHVLTDRGTRRRLEFSVDTPCHPSALAVVTGPLAAFVPPGMRDTDARVMDRQGEGEGFF